MISLEASLSLGTGFLSGAALVIWRGGVMLGKLTQALTTLTSAVDRLTTEVDGLKERIHDIDKSGAVTRAKLESLNGEARDSSGDLDR